jgi:membrane protein
VAKPGRRWRAAGAAAFQVAPWIALAATAVAWRRAAAKPRPGLSLEETASPVSFEIAEPRRGRLAGNPFAIPPKGWKDVAWRTLREISVDRLPSVAGGVTYFALLALFPAIGVFVSLYGLFADVAQVRGQLDQMAMFVPPDVLKLVGDQMVRLASAHGGSLSLAFVISLLLSAWSANAGMKSFFDGLNIAYDETERRSYLRRTVLTYGFTIAALVFSTVVAGLLVAVPLVLTWIDLPGLDLAWLPLRWLILFGLAAAAFSVFYRYGPSREPPRWRWVGIGGVVAALLWLVGSLGFSWYANHVVHLDATYGSLGAVIGFMLWIWFSVLVVLIGAEFNAEIEHQTALDSTTGAPLPMGSRGAAMADTVGLAFHFDIRKLLTVPMGAAKARARRKGQPNSSSKAASRPA